MSRRVPPPRFSYGYMRPTLNRVVRPIRQAANEIKQAAKRNIKETKNNAVASFGNFFSKDFGSTTFFFVVAAACLASLFIENCKSELWVAINKITPDNLRPTAKSLVIFGYHLLILSTGWVGTRKFKGFNSGVLAFSALFLWYFRSAMDAVDVSILAVTLRMYLCSNNAESKILISIVGTLVLALWYAGVRFLHFFPTLKLNAEHCSINGTLGP